MANTPRVTAIIPVFNGARFMAAAIASLQRQSLARRVTAYVRRSTSVSEALSLKVSHHATTDLGEAVRDSDLVILCTPIAQMKGLSESLLPHLRPGTLVTDVGSVKASLVADLEPLFQSQGCTFVGSHPMAGGEKIGMAHARADLFQNAVCVVTPTKLTSPKSLSVVRQLWEGLGSSLLEMSPEAHDQLVGRSSHLPHVLAAELASYVLNPCHPAEQPQLCAGGFRDTTRIASGSPEMWRDICLANARNLSSDLGSFIQSLQEFQGILNAGDGPAVEDFFRKAKGLRDSWQQGRNNPSDE